MSIRLPFFILPCVVLFQSGYMFGCTGTGGQMGYADSQHKLGISFLTNYWSLFNLGDDPRYLALERAIYRCIPGTYKEETSPWYW